MGKICKCKTIYLLNATMKTFQYSWKRSSLVKYVYPVDWREMIKIAAFIWRQSYVSYQWVISDSSVFHKYYMRLFTYSVRDIHTPIYFFQWFSVILRCNKRETCVICLLIVSGKSSTNAIAATFSQTITDIPRTFRALSALGLRKLRKKYVKQRNTAQTFTRSQVLSCSKPGIA